MEQQEKYSRVERDLRSRLAQLGLFTLVLMRASIGADLPATPEKIVAGADTYIDPRYKKEPEFIYPWNEYVKGVEGWVTVQMMVDPKGKPYEIEMVASTGNKDFEATSLKAAKKMQFHPAKLGGKPIDAAYAQTFYFRTKYVWTVSDQFRKAYDDCMKLIAAKDRAAADTALAGLQATNIYENAYVGLAQYSYAKQWGTEQQQLRGLRIAVSGATTPVYLPKDAFLVALRELFLIEVKTQDYASAMSTWRTLQAVDKDPETMAKFKPIAADVEAMRTDPRQYKVPATLTNGAWAFRLYRNRFFIEVLEGHVSQIKLYCEKKYVLFSFDPKLEYKVEDKFGKCTMVVYGDAKTSIELVQTT